MNIVTINDNNLTNEQIGKFANKVRAILIKNDKLLIANYNSTIMLPGGSIDKGETPSNAIIRELKEEIGITYNINDLNELFVLRHYQSNYPSKDNQTINRLITTYFYIGQCREINFAEMKRTESEMQSNFYVDLVELRKLPDLIRAKSNNPRKKYFDTEMETIIKIYNKNKCMEGRDER